MKRFLPYLSIALALLLFSFTTRSVTSEAGSDYTFCHKNISVTLFDGGKAIQTKFGINGITEKTVKGEWTAYGSVTDMPGQTIKILFDGSQLEYSYELIRDGYGIPSVLVDGEGRRYTLCKTKKSSGIASDGNKEISNKQFCGKFQDVDNGFSITVSESKGELKAVAFKNGKSVSAKFKCGNSSEYRGQPVDYGIPISWEEVSFKLIHPNCPTEKSATEQYSFSVQVWKDDHHVKIRGSLPTIQNQPKPPIEEETKQVVKKDPAGKDMANVFYKPEYTLFDFLTDEPIFPDSLGIYNIFYATNEEKTPKQLKGSAQVIAQHTVYKFKDFQNCSNWCTGKTK